MRAETRLNVLSAAACFNRAAVSAADEALALPAPPLALSAVAAVAAEEVDPRLAAEMDALALALVLALAMIVPGRRGNESDVDEDDGGDKAEGGESVPEPPGRFCGDVQEDVTLDEGRDELADAVPAAHPLIPPASDKLPVVVPDDPASEDESTTIATMGGGWRTMPPPTPAAPEPVPGPSIGLRVAPGVEPATLTGVEKPLAPVLVLA